MQLLITRNFNGVALDCYVEDGQRNSQDFWATRTQIGQLLGYEDPKDAVKKIHARHKERIDKFSRGDKLSLLEGGRLVTRKATIYSFKGLPEICRHSNQPIADHVMDVLWDIADEIRAQD